MVEANADTSSTRHSDYRELEKLGFSEDAGCSVRGSREGAGLF